MTERDLSPMWRGRRLKAARDRFERQAAEMRAWGCDVTIPDHLTIPDEKPTMPTTNQRKSDFRAAS